MFEWSEVIRQLSSFLFLFFSTGAIAFRLFVLRRHADNDIEAVATKRAATIGLIGAIGSLFLFFAITAPKAAARQHTDVLHAITSNATLTVQTACVALLVVSLGVALSRVDAAWYAAALATFAAPFAPLLTPGKWERVVNPLHRLGGGLWIGTLFVMLVAGFVAVFRSGADATRRGEIVSRMVRSFSPLALSAFVLLAFSGVKTAILHLKRWDAIWTTPYGYAFMAKMCVVLVVIALGAWNWRRQRPLLGTESAANMMRRSATAEVIAASVVLMITSLLVSLPSPE